MAYPVFPKFEEYTCFFGFGLLSQFFLNFFKKYRMVDQTYQTGGDRLSHTPFREVLFKYHEERELTVICEFFLTKYVTSPEARGRNSQILPYPANCRQVSRLFVFNTEGNLKKADSSDHSHLEMSGFSSLS